jgi:hypothetical protein
VCGGVSGRGVCRVCVGGGAAVCEELETGLMLLGAAAVEDKLQV